MKVCLLIGRMAAGGNAEKVMAMLANHLFAKGWDVFGNEVNRTHFQINERINIIDRSPSVKKSYFANLFIWLWNIRKLVKEQKPDIIISFLGRINSLVLTSTIGIDVPVIVSERNDPRHENQGKFLLKYCDLVYLGVRSRNMAVKMFSEVVFVSKYIALIEK